VVPPENFISTKEYISLWKSRAREREREKGYSSILRTLTLTGSNLITWQSLLPRSKQLPTFLFQCQNNGRLIYSSTLRPP
jgi:hypothetical protein